MNPPPVFLVIVKTPEGCALMGAFSNLEWAKRFTTVCPPPSSWEQYQVVKMPLDIAQRYEPWNLKHGYQRWIKGPDGKWVEEK